MDPSKTAAPQVTHEFLPEDVMREFTRLMPVCTADVVFFNASATRALLFRRSSPPLRGDWFSVGGRMWKNERALDCALRQAEKETGLRLDPERLFFGGVFDEIHDESRFGGDVTYHAVNLCWGYLLPEDAAIRLDHQHDAHAWKSISDETLHPMIRRKIQALHPLAARLAAAGKA